MKYIINIVILALAFTASAQTSVALLRDAHVAAAEAGVKMEAARVELAKANEALVSTQSAGAVVGQAVRDGDYLIREAQTKLDAAAGQAVVNMSSAWSVWKAEQSAKLEVAFQKVAADTAAAIEATARSEAARLQAAASITSAADKVVTQLLVPTK